MSFNFKEVHVVDSPSILISLPTRAIQKVVAPLYKTTCPPKLCGPTLKKLKEFV
jgi:hypothetical protein